LKKLFIQTNALYDAQVPLEPKNLLTSIFELCPQLESGREEDSNEFLSVFLDQLNMEEEAQAQKPMDTIVNSLFWAVYLIPYPTLNALISLHLKKNFLTCHSPFEKEVLKYQLRSCGLHILRKWSYLKIGHAHIVRLKEKQSKKFS